MGLSKNNILYNLWFFLKIFKSEFFRDKNVEIVASNKPFWLKGSEKSTFPTSNNNSMQKIYVAAKKC